MLALLVFLGIPARRRGWRAMVGMLGILFALGGLAACGGGGSGGGGSGNSDPGTASGSYTFTVTGTGNDAASHNCNDNVHSYGELNRVPAFRHDGPPAGGPSCFWLFPDADAGRWIVLVRLPR